MSCVCHAQQQGLLVLDHVAAVIVLSGLSHKVAEIKNNALDKLRVAAFLLVRNIWY